MGLALVWSGRYGQFEKVLSNRYGNWRGKLFLVGFLGCGDVLTRGCLDGVSQMFADFVGTRRKPIVIGHCFGGLIAQILACCAAARGRG